MRLLDLMEPEETIGNLWHDMASGIGAEVSYPDAAVTLCSLRPSLWAGAAAVNVFFASLIFSWVGGPVAPTA